MHLSTMLEWLEWISSIHFSEIELGLDRVKAVADKLAISLTCPVITVAGTNGKGSTVAGLESIYLAAGFQVGAFTSPVLFRHNEQVRINGTTPADQAFCDAFEMIEKKRGSISLTPFEYHTLAALLIFQQHPLDVVILEVGLGGRLDAVNIVDADVAIVTTISLDHTEWLGGTREEIAREKAGIFRPERPAICGDFNPPATLIEKAKEIGALFFCQARDFFYDEFSDHWSWEWMDVVYKNLPLTALALQNMSTVLMAVTLLQKQLPVDATVIKQGLANVKLIGRIQVVDGPVQEVYDVSHNPASVALLADWLKAHPVTGKTYAVFSMLGDKDVRTSVSVAKKYVDEWHLAQLDVKRAAPLSELKEACKLEGILEVQEYGSVKDAYLAIKQIAKPRDRILIFGSFHTVAGIS
ncbi:MAG: bifunctional tetrahydrofolate synthase/dihydrofolate synthase [Gammaproteobacteria bacterium]